MLRSSRQKVERPAAAPVAQADARVTVRGYPGPSGRVKGRLREARLSLRPSGQLSAAASIAALRRSS
jgi:hypothetical protein